MLNKIIVRYFLLFRMPEIDETENNKCWQECEATRILIHWLKIFLAVS